MTTSVQSLAPESPFLRVLDSKPMAPWVKHHNIIGSLDDVKVINRVATATDGVVKVQSAHSETATSELVVSGDHVNVHQTPAAILEVRRILLAHLEELRSTYHSASK